MCVLKRKMAHSSWMWECFCLHIQASKKIKLSFLFLCVCVWGAMNLHVLHYIVLQNQRNTLVFDAVYVYLYPRIWVCSRTVSLSESSAPLLPCSPSGWTVKHTQPLLISWWSYSVPVLYNSPRTHSSAAPPTGVPLVFFVFFFFFSFLWTTGQRVGIGTL